MISLFVIADSVVSASFSGGSIGSGQAIVQRGVDAFLGIVSAVWMFTLNIVGRFKLGVSLD